MVVILYNGSYLFSYAWEYSPISVFFGYQWSFSTDQKAGQELRANEWYLLRANSRCKYSIATLNCRYLNRRGIEINVFGLKLLLKRKVTWSTLRRMLWCSRLPMQGEQDEGPRKKDICFETGEILRYAASWNKSTFDIKEVLVMNWA